MNAESFHQYYGGEISDYLVKKQNFIPGDNTLQPSERALCDIYNTQVKHVGQVAITNSPTNINLDALIEHQPDPLTIQLQDTLSRVAQEHGLIANKAVTDTNFKPTLKDQSTDDIHQANDAVIKALEELRALGEI